MFIPFIIALLPVGFSMGVGRKSTVYELLAVAAATRCGVDPATAVTCAENESSRRLRDSLWSQLDDRLNDNQTFTLDQIRQWAAAEGARDISRSAIHRLRANAVSERKQVAARANEMNRWVNELDQRGDLDAARVNRAAAQQIVFDALQGFDPAVLSGLTANQALRLLSTVGYLSKASAETELLEQRLAELRRAFDEAVAAKVKAKPGGALSPEDIGEIRRAVFGEQAA